MGGIEYSKFLDFQKNIIILDPLLSEFKLIIFNWNKEIFFINFIAKKKIIKEMQFKSLWIFLFYLFIKRNNFNFKLLKFFKFKFFLWKALLKIIFLYYYYNCILNYLSA